MAEEHTKDPSSRGKSRRERVEYARSRDILDVASELSMELVRSGRDYRWKEHDSMVVSPDKNMWNWFSRHQGGDVISLVETMKEVNFNQAIDYLNDGSFKEYKAVERVQETFSYYLEPYEQPFEAARSYLKDQRGLSDETIDFFLEKGVLAQANAKVNGSIEPVIVFKSFDFSGEMVGATLQGIEENWEKWPERGYAKNIVKNSDGITGMHVDIGQPNRLIFAESAIDLMSYYELHREQLQDVRLVSMDGLKEGVIGRHLAQLKAELSGRPLERTHDQLADALKTAIANRFFEDGKHADLITLAVDNDKGGRNFVDSLREKGAVVTEDLPELQASQEKMDWNDYLKQTKQENDVTQPLVEHLLTVARKDLPANIQANETVQELLGQVEEMGQTAYFWVTEEDLGQTETIISQIDDWFSSGKVDEVYKSELFELVVGDNTYMVDFKDGTISLQNMEAYAQYISERMDAVGLEGVTTELEAVITDFHQVKEAITEAMTKEVESAEKKMKQEEPPQDQETKLVSQQKTSDEVRRENEVLVKHLEERIKDGDLAIQFDTDVYLYDVFSKLGNSHPVKYLNANRMEVLAPLQPILASIDEKNVDLYKNKGTMEQDSLYQALKSHQRTLGVEISTRFIGELAIAAYTTNKQLESLSADQFGIYYGTRTLDNLSQSIERILEYPLNEAGAKDYTYGFLTTPNAFYHYLKEQEGEVVLGQSDLDNLLSRIEKEPVQIVDPTQEEHIVSEAKEKPLDDLQEVGVTSEQQKMTGHMLGDLSESTQKAAPLPETNESFPLNDLLPNQTQDQSLLHFTISNPRKSIPKSGYHVATKRDMERVNSYAGQLQEATRWYLSNLVNTSIFYVYQDDTLKKPVAVKIKFEERHFMHLTGLFPIQKGQTAEKTLHDFANGNGHFENLMVANRGAVYQKLQVLPELQDVLRTDAFYFDDVKDIPRLHNIDMKTAIKSDEGGFITAFKNNSDNTSYPASLLELTPDLQNEFAQASPGKTILGIYRERDGILEQVAINEDYIKDNGEKLSFTLKNKQYEELLDMDRQSINSDQNVITEMTEQRIEQEKPLPTDTLSAELFTQVLDSAYNVGDPRKLGVQVPEESKIAWERYYELSDNYEGNFNAIVNAAEQLGLVDKDSSFYQEWIQDRIYNENYHVRLQWAETWPDGPQIPFKETELVDYQTFAEELYKQNRAFYERHQESAATVDATGNQDAYIPCTKVKFDVYAPGGTLIKSDVHYDVGNETEPISRLLGLGYRRLEGQSELAAIDDKILSQLENQEVNQAIAAEANE